MTSASAFVFLWGKGINYKDNGPFIVRRSVWEQHKELHQLFTYNEDDGIGQEVIGAFLSITLGSPMITDPRHPDDLLAEAVACTGDVYTFRKPLGGNEFYEAEVYIDTIHEYLTGDMDDDGWDEQYDCSSELVRHIPTDWSTHINLPAVRGKQALTLNQQAI